MKKLLFVAFIALHAGFLNAQDLHCSKDGNCWLVFTSFNATEAHDVSANAFDKQVGARLKHTPSRVTDLKVVLEVIVQAGRPFYGLTWMCKIRPTSEGFADYSFTRRGTLRPGNTLDEAKAQVKRENVDKRRKFHHDNPLWKERTTRQTSWGPQPDGWWYLEEIFFTQPPFPKGIR